MGVKLVTIAVKHQIRRRTLHGKHYLHARLDRTRKKTRIVARKAGRAAKNAIIPSLPGVSKVQLPEPPAPQLLVSNYPPNDSESALIVKAIEKAEAEARRWAETLEQRRRNGQTSRSWIMVTTHKIEQANRFVRRHKGLISPIRRLPTEILQEIFRWVGQTTQMADRKWRWNKLLPWVLGQICQSWRIVALDTPSLWAQLPTVHLKNKKKKTKTQLQYLSELLHRSRGAPLDISIDTLSFFGVEHNVVELLCQHAERWEAALICVPSKALTGFHSIKGRLLALKSLILMTPLTHRLHGPIDLFEVAPLLTTVYLVRPFSGGDVILPFSQLIDYRERLTFGNQLNPAISSPTLETLTMLELTDDIVFPSVTIPHLVKLQVGFEYRSQHNCFDNLTLPVIEDIRVVSYRGNLMPSLIIMLSKTSPSSLKSFCVRFEFIDNNDLTNLLVLTPHLVTLHITLPSSHSDILNLASGYHNQPLVPLLETCEFYAENLIGADLTNALNLLASSRCEPGGNLDNVNLLPGEARPLKTLSIHFDGPEWAHMQHGQLENWSAATTTSEALEYLKCHLHAKLPDLPYGYCDQPKKLGIGWNNKLGQILAGIESVKVDDVRDIYMSRVHYSLKIISNWTDSSHGNCAQRVLDKWQPLIEESLEDRHWAFQRPYALLYIAKDHALRKSPEDAMTIAYGLKERIPFAAAMWPMFMSIM
ncbi:hypothetical protein CVT25_000166 [Psilocybe cyanescens]|uniref:Uncharacterized protein n=1 Tax=Psilocybe cyanescens TaxID=93625 RepID=A0A409XQ82_PSICY|nr:hypothetical protein CVT25_000166 [Psilocybe cyanescens]